jgi:hypothetical protein
MHERELNIKTTTEASGHYIRVHGRRCRGGLHDLCLFFDEIVNVVFHRVLRAPSRRFSNGV